MPVEDVTLLLLELGPRISVEQLLRNLVEILCFRVVLTTLLDLLHHLLVLRNDVMPKLDAV